MMVPEINLTPQLEERVKARFGAEGVVSMHSGMTGPQRLKSWLAAHNGSARIVLGTRMAVFASMPHLKWIVVDEEHDASYKQQEGARYSARDLAVYRARLEGAKVILGSATPSLESWHQSRPANDGGRYMRLQMPARIGEGQLPFVRRVDMNHQPRKTVLSAPLIAAIQERVAKGEQSMLLLNRRGYAPVLHCADCGWKSECAHCSAFRVFHKIDRTLRCHHCGLTDRVPRHCPGCGDADLGMLGRGTEMLEEQLAELLSGLTRPDGQAVRIARIDADSTRLQGALEQQLAQVHAGDVDILVGTQMIAKGLHFPNVTLVGIVHADLSLHQADFRAGERTFQLLTQVSGRAGRGDVEGEVFVQSFTPFHPAIQYARRHDYLGFYEQEVEFREQLRYPPVARVALLTLKGRNEDKVKLFAEHLRKALDAGFKDWKDLILAGPAPAPLLKAESFFRHQIMLRTSAMSRLSIELGKIEQTFALPADLTLIIDIDPVNLG